MHYSYTQKDSFYCIHYRVGRILYSITSMIMFIIKFTTGSMDYLSILYIVLLVSL